jgi:diguanylate cyclase (GGDEF)-like protein
MSSAALLLGDGSRRPAAAEGPLAPLLLDLPTADGEQLVEYVARATSSWADGIEEGDGFEATRAMRSRGVSSLVVLALVAKGSRQGVLVLEDEHPHAALARVIPLLEMLAATAAAMLAAAAAAAALQRSERELVHQATHDALTGVVNRARLLEDLASLLGDRRGRDRLVVLFVDLDGFKVVNDVHGHRAGDRLLVAVADRLRHAARGSDLVARLGGDEFVVLCPGVESVGEATAVGDRVLERLSAPFRLGDVDESVTACIGIAPAAGHADAETLLDVADRAMYAAKRAGTGTWALADEHG